MIQLLTIEKDLSTYDKTLKSLLETEASQHILKGLTAGLPKLDQIHYSSGKDHGVALRHLVAGCDDPREYLFDCSIIATSSRAPLEAATVESTLRELSRALKSGSPAQKFYSSLLLGAGPQDASREILGLSPQDFATLQNWAELKRPLIHVRAASIRKTGT